MSRVIGYRVVASHEVPTNRELAEALAKAYGPEYRVAELRETGTCIWYPNALGEGCNTSCGVEEVQVLHGDGADSTAYCPFCAAPVEVAP